MKGVYPVVGMAWLLGFIWVQNAVGDDQISEDRWPVAHSEHVHTRVIPESEPGASERAGTLPNSRSARANGGRIFRGKRPTDQTNYVPGEIIVRFKQDVPEEAIAELNSRQGVSVIYTSPFAGFKRLRIAGGTKLTDILEIYKDNPNVEYAELNYIASAYWTPNDPLYSYQWHLDNTAYGGIQMEDAWQLLGAPGTPGENIIVAVVDSGVAYEDHPAPDHWHIDTYDAYGGSGRSWWCGVLTAPSSWYSPYKTPPGYGNGWRDYLQHSFDITTATGEVTFS